MEPVTRHQCVIYDGAPSNILPHLAVVARQRLKQNYRCFYLNSPKLVDSMCSYLAAVEVNVAQELAKGSLILSSSQTHLVNGQFDIDGMIAGLEDGAEQALRDGYKGLWATGDMTWEFGPRKNFSKLLEYEWQLEQLFHRQPALSGICQYHQDMLPHEAIFVNETLSRINPNYVHAESFADLQMARSAVA
jgi:hypothetical protein